MLSAILLTVATISQVDYVLLPPSRPVRDYAVVPVRLDGDGKRSVVVARGITPPTSRPATTLHYSAFPPLRATTVIRRVPAPPTTTTYWLPPSLYPMSRIVNSGEYYSTCPTCR